MTGKRLLRLEHGQRVGMAAKKKGRRPRQDGDGGDGAGAGGGGEPLSGLEKGGSDTSSSSRSDDGDRT